MFTDKDLHGTSAENTAAEGAAAENASIDLAQTDLLSTHRPSRIQGWTIMAYSAVCYFMAVGTLITVAAFVGDFGGIRTAEAAWMFDSAWARGALNTGFLLLFAVQHSVMARQGFKNWITRYISGDAERSTYLLATNVVLLATVAFWQPLPGMFFQVEGSARMAVNGLLILGFVIVLISSFLIDHFHLFGLKQGFQALKHGKSRPARFVTPLFYRWVRHPLMSGMLILIWSMADISLDRLFLNLAMTGYVFVGVYFEERALTGELGDVYRTYKRHVPAVIPGLRPAWPPKADPVQGPSVAAEAA